MNEFEMEKVKFETEKKELLQQQEMTQKYIKEKELRMKNAIEMEKIKEELRKCKEKLKESESKPYIIRVYDEKNELYGSATIVKNVTKATPRKRKMNENTMKFNKDTESEELNQEFENIINDYNQEMYIQNESKNSQKDLNEEMKITKRNDERNDVDDKDQEYQDDKDQEYQDDKDQEHQDDKDQEHQDDEDEDHEKIDNEDVETVTYLNQNRLTLYNENDPLKLMDKIWVTYASENEFDYIYEGIVTDIDDKNVKCQLKYKDELSHIQVLKSDCYTSPYDNLYTPIYKKGSTMKREQEMKVGLRVFVLYDSNELGKKKEYFYEGKVTKINENGKVDIYFTDENRTDQIPIKRCILHPSLNKPGVEIFQHAEYQYNNNNNNKKKRKFNEFEEISLKSNKANEFDEEEERLYKYMQNENILNYVTNYLNSYYEVVANEDFGVMRSIFADGFREDMKKRHDDIVYDIHGERFTNKSDLENELYTLKSQFLQLMTGLFARYKMIAGGHKKHVKMITNLMKAYEESCNKSIILKNKKFSKIVGKTKFLVSAK